MAKLTLYIDDEQVLATAKACAQRQGLSLSKLVTQYFATLPEAEDFSTELHAELRAEGFKPPTDEDVEALRAHHVREKYL